MLFIFSIFHTVSLMSYRIKKSARSEKLTLIVTPIGIGVSRARGGKKGGKVLSSFLNNYDESPSLADSEWA